MLWGATSESRVASSRRAPPTILNCTSSLSPTFACNSRYIVNRNTIHALSAISRLVRLDPAEQSRTALHLLPQPRLARHGQSKHDRQQRIQPAVKLTRRSASINSRLSSSLRCGWPLVPEDSLRVAELGEQDLTLLQRTSRPCPARAGASPPQAHSAPRPLPAPPLPGRAPPLRPPCRPSDA